MPTHSFNFSFELSASSNLSTPQQNAVRPESRLVARPFDAFTLTPTKVLVRVMQLETLHRLDSFDFAVLQQCDQLRTPTEHADEVCRRHGAAVRARALESLESLQKRGLLASEHDLGMDFGRAGAPARRPALETLYIRSSGRPQALARALTSIVDGRCARSGISRCIVIDDTRDAATHRQMDALIARARKQTGIQLLHFGADHRRRLVETIARRADIAEHHLDWYIRGQSDRDQRYGCGINIALLMSAGRRFGLLDDDASLDVVAGDHDPEPSHVAVCNSNDYRAAFPEPGPVAPPFRELDGFDPVAAHEAWLGRTAGEVIAGLGPRPASFADLTPMNLAELRPEGRIRFTVNGVFGDPGTRSPRWLFCQPVEQLEEWMQGAARYSTALERRWTMRCEPDLRAVVDYSLMTTTLTGVDNATLILPTLPHGAGEDSLLGEIVRFMDPGSLQLGMPWMLKHQPEQPRRWSTEDVVKPAALNAGLFFRSVLLNLSAVANSGDHRVRAGLLKQTLLDLAQADDRELRTELVRQVMGARSSISMHIANSIADAALPDYLKHEYNRLIEANIESPDMEATRLGTAADSIRDIARRYASSMDAWIPAWNCAREIGETNLVEELFQQ